MDSPSSPEKQELLKVETTALRESPHPYGYYGYAGEQSSTNSLGDYWRVVLKRRWVVISCFVIGLAATTIITARTQRIYESVATINIASAPDDILGFKNRDNQESIDYQVQLETQSRILRGESMALLVARKLNLAQTAEYGGSTPPKPGAPLDPARETAMVKSLRQHIRVVTVPGTQLLDIHITSTDRERSAEIANAYIDTYIEQNTKAKYEATARSTE